MRVPEDVVVAANVAFNSAHAEGRDTYSALECAILAERKRCAGIAGRHAIESEWTDGVIEARRIADEIEAGQ